MQMQGLERNKKNEIQSLYLYVNWFADVKSKYLKKES